MKLMTFNVLFGGHDRFDAICAIVAAARPDVLVLQECLGWEDGVRLRAVAEAIGVPGDDAHVVLGTANPRGSGRRFHVCLVSRAPITAPRVHAPPALAHCMVEATIVDRGQPLTIYGAHLVAADEDARLRELDAILARAPPTGRCALLGDLNALAAHDPYPPDLDARLTGAGIDKYGHPPRFDVMSRLFEAGWIDALHHRPPGAAWVTAVRLRAHGGTPVETRTDYVLLSPALRAELSSVAVIDVGAASDHHAVIATLASAASSGRAIEPGR